MCIMYYLSGTYYLKFRHLESFRKFFRHDDGRNQHFPVLFSISVIILPLPHSVIYTKSFSIKAVSYTHLDVYKRQVWGWSSPCRILGVFLYSLISPDGPHTWLNLCRLIHVVIICNVNSL